MANSSFNKCLKMRPTKLNIHSPRNGQYYDLHGQCSKSGASYLNYDAPCGGRKAETEPVVGQRFSLTGPGREFCCSFLQETLDSIVKSDIVSITNKIGT